MSVMIIVSLKVTDFDALRSGFDAHANARTEAGMDAKAYQNIDDPNNAIAIAALLTKSEMQEAQKKASVLAPSEMKFLEEVEFNVYGMSPNTKAPHVRDFALREMSAVLIQ